MFLLLLTMSFNTLHNCEDQQQYIFQKYHKIVLNSHTKNSNKTIFYLVYSPSEQCAHNQLELELESKLDVSGFEAAACNEWV